MFSGDAVARALWRAAPALMRMLKKPISAADEHR
jgi:hypothetical protein